MAGSSVFEALSHPTRREILRVLRANDSLLAGQIADLLGIAAPTLSGHLSVLKNADLVIGERNGTTIRYRVNTTVIEDALTTFLGTLRLGNGDQRGGGR